MTKPTHVLQTQLKLQPHARISYIQTILWDYSENTLHGLLREQNTLSTFIGHFSDYLTTLDKTTFSQLDIKKEWNDIVLPLLIQLLDISNFTATEACRRIYSALQVACDKDFLQKEQSELHASLLSLLALLTPVLDEKTIAETYSTASAQSTANTATLPTVAISNDALIDKLKPLYAAMQDRQAKMSSSDSSEAETIFRKRKAGDQAWNTLIDELIDDTNKASELKQAIAVLYKTIATFTLEELTKLATYLDFGALLHGPLLNIFCRRFVELTPNGEQSRIGRAILLSDIAPIAHFLAKQLFIEINVENRGTIIRETFSAIRWALEGTSINMALGINLPKGAPFIDSKTRQERFITDLDTTVWALGTLCAHLTREQIQQEAKGATQKMLIKILKGLGKILPPTVLFQADLGLAIMGNLRRFRRTIRAKGTLLEQIPELASEFDKHITTKIADDILNEKFARQQTRNFSTQKRTLETEVVETIASAFSLIKTNNERNEFTNPNASKNVLDREVFAQGYRVDARLMFEGKSYCIEFDGTAFHQLCWIPIKGIACKTHLNGETLGKQKFISMVHHTSGMDTAKPTVPSLYINISQQYWMALKKEYHVGNTSVSQRIPIAFLNRVKTEVLSGWPNDKCDCQGGALAKSLGNQTVCRVLTTSISPAPSSPMMMATTSTAIPSPIPMAGSLFRFSSDDRKVLLDSVVPVINATTITATGHHTELPRSFPSITEQFDTIGSNGSYPKPLLFNKMKSITPKVEAKKTKAIMVSTAPK